MAAGGGVGALVPVRAAQNSLDEYSQSRQLTCDLERCCALEIE